MSGKKKSWRAKYWEKLSVDGPVSFTVAVLGALILSVRGKLAKFLNEPRFLPTWCFFLIGIAFLVLLLAWVQKERSAKY